MPLKTLILGKRHAGRALGAVLSQAFRLSPREVEHYLKNRWVRLDGELCQQPGQRVRGGQRLQVAVPRRKPALGRGRNTQAPVKGKPDLPPIAQAIRI